MWTKAGPVSVRVVVVEDVEVEVLVGVTVADVFVVVELEDDDEVCVRLVVEELLVVAGRVVVVVVVVTVTVSVRTDPHAASSAAAARATAAKEGLSGIFVTWLARFPFAIRNASGYRPGGRERERWLVEQRRAMSALLYTSSQVRSAGTLAVVTISSSYGALGSEVGRAVASELGVPFLDRAIPVEVAERLAVPLEEARSRDEALAGFLERLLSAFVTMGSVYGSAMPPVEVPDEEAFRAATEQTIREHARSGDAVIVGRAGMIVLADHPHVLRVRLSGPLEARIQQASDRYGLTLEEARRQERENDGARAAWVRRLYGRDVTDPALYDLTINATRFGVSECVGLIVTALRSV